MKQLIAERLERYTDLPESLIADIARQVMLALDVENAPNIVVMDEYNYETELEKARENSFFAGQRDGYMKALDDLMEVEKLGYDPTVRIECLTLKAAYTERP